MISELTDAQLAQERRAIGDSGHQLVKVTITFDDGTDSEYPCIEEACLKISDINLGAAISSWVGSHYTNPICCEWEILPHSVLDDEF